MITAAKEDLKEPVLRNLDPSKQPVGGIALTTWTDKIIRIFVSESEKELHVGFREHHEFKTGWRCQKGVTKGGEFLLKYTVMLGGEQLHCSEEWIYVPNVPEMQLLSGTNVLLGVLNPLLKYKFDLRLKDSIENGVEVTFELAGTKGIISKLLWPVKIIRLDDVLPEQVSCDWTKS